jgi:AcrR family transcriptional regulator
MALRAIAAEKRQHIVATAYALFKKHGFHATGIDRIIAEAKVAKMTMYRHFPSKYGLIVEVLDWRSERFARQLDAFEKVGKAPHQKIAAIFDWYARWFDTPAFHGCLFQHALAEFGDHGHPVFKAAARQKNALKRRLQKILETGMPQAQAESTAAALLMLIEGATLMAQMGRGKEAIKDARQAAARLLDTPAETK